MLLGIVKERRVRLFAHVERAKGTLVNTIFQVKKLRGRPARQWLDDVNEFTGLRLNEIWMEPEDCVDLGKRVCCVATANRKVYSVHK